MSKLIEQETLRHREAFDFYYSLAHERSYSKVAKQFKVSSVSVKKWANSFNWQDRIKEIDAQVAARLDSETVEAVVSQSQKITQIVDKLIDRCTVTLPSGEVVPTFRVENLQDFATLVKLHQLLNGDPTERTEFVAGNAREKLAERLAAQATVREAEEFIRQSNE